MAKRSNVTAVKKSALPKTATYQNKKKTTRKEIARTLIANEISDSGVNHGIIPCLSAEKWETERKIAKNKNNDFTFWSFEVEPIIYDKTVKNGQLIPFSKKPCYFFSHIGEMLMKFKSDSFAHILLDYCKGIENYLTELEYILNNDIIGVNGIVACTFNLRGKSFEYKRFLNDMNTINTPSDKYKDNDSKTEHAIRTFFMINNTRKNYRIGKSFNYRDGMPMMLLFIHRIK